MARGKTYYMIEKPWQRSPEVIKTVGGWIIGSFVIGFIAALFLVGSIEDEAKKLSESKPLKPCPTSAPKEPK